MGAGNLDGQSCFLHRFFLYGWQDNTNLHEILTDIAAKRKPRRGDFANGVLNSYNDFIIYVVESSSHIHAIRMTSQNLPFRKTSSFK